MTDLRQGRTVVSIIVLSMGAHAWAAEAPPEAPPTPGGPTNVVTKFANVTFSGELDLTLVYRSREYFTATKGDGVTTNGDLPFLSKADTVGINPATGLPFSVRDPGQTGITNASRLGYGTRPTNEVYLDPNLILNFAVDVGHNTRGVIELRTPFVNPDAGGKNTTPGTGGFSTASDKFRQLEVKKLYVEVDELLQPSGREHGTGLLLRAGIQDFRKDFCETGNPFVIDVSGGKFPFDTPTGNPPSASVGFADATEAAGGYGQYKLSIFDIDAWFFELDSTYNALGQPDHVLFWGGSADLFFDEKKNYGKFFLTAFDLMNSTSCHLPTEGLGVVVKPLRTDRQVFLKLFGEVYIQQGDYARHAASPYIPAGELGSSAAPFTRIKQRDAYALQLGAKGWLPAMFEDKFVPYGEASYVQVSGDDNIDDKNKNFVSLENNNATVVVENGYYGYNIDQNYRGPRFALGFNYAKWEFKVLYAYFELCENGGHRMTGLGSRSRKIGDEIDVSAWYEWTENLKLGIQSGWLMDTRALGQSASTQITLFSMALKF